MRVHDHPSRNGPAHTSGVSVTHTQEAAESALVGARHLRGVCTRQGDPDNPDYNTEHGKAHRADLRRRIAGKRWRAKDLRGAGHGLIADEMVFLLDEAEEGLRGERQPEVAVEAAPRQMTIGDAVRGVAKSMPKGGESGD